jgi:large subunit ribosomal protein L4
MMAGDDTTSEPVKKVNAPFFDPLGRRGADVELPSNVFAVEPNVPVMHAVVTAELAAARAGTQSTKTRAEVRGGGVKPWRQKGTGRARAGSIREPQWVGGGVAHAPKPRSYAKRINKKEKALALRGALSSQALEGKFLVVEIDGFKHPETKRAVDLLDGWGAEGRVLLVLGKRDDQPANVWKSFRNLPHVMSVSSPTASMILAADTVVVTKTFLDSFTKDGESK